MLHADELQKGQNQIPFPLALLGVRMPQAKSAKITSSTMEHAVQPYEVQVSGSQVLRPSLRIGVSEPVSLGAKTMVVWRIRLFCLQRYAGTYLANAWRGHQTVK
jgi:hypothetical protein